MPQPLDKTKVKEWKQKISNSLKGRRCSIKSEYCRGRTPWNKGTIGLMKANKTSFKKGNIPKNYMGGMKICKDGIYIINRRKSYTYIYKQIIWYLASLYCKYIGFNERIFKLIYLLNHHLCL